MVLSSSSSTSFFFSLRLFLLSPTNPGETALRVRSFLPPLPLAHSLARSLPSSSSSSSRLADPEFNRRQPGRRPRSPSSRRSERRRQGKRGRSPVDVGENERAEASERATSPVAEGREKALSSRPGPFGGGILAGVARRDRRLHLPSFPPPGVHSETSLDGMVRTHHRSARCPVLRDIL